MVKDAPGDFKAHNHETCRLGSSGTVTHLVRPGSSPPSQSTTPEPSQDAPRRSNPSWAGSVSSVEFAKIPCGPSRSAKTRCVSCCWKWNQGFNTSRNSEFYQIPDSFPEFYRFLSPKIDPTHPSPTGHCWVLQGSHSPAARRPTRRAPSPPPFRPGRVSSEPGPIQR